MIIGWLPYRSPNFTHSRLNEMYPIKLAERCHARDVATFSCYLYLLVALPHSCVSNLLESLPPIAYHH